MILEYGSQVTSSASLIPSESMRPFTAESA